MSLSPISPQRFIYLLRPKMVCGLKVVVCSQYSSRLIVGSDLGVKRLPRLLLLCATFGLVMSLMMVSTACRMCEGVSHSPLCAMLGVARWSKRCGRAASEGPTAASLEGAGGREGGVALELSLVW